MAAKGGKLRIAIVGCGGMGKGHVKAVMSDPDFELVGACDINPEALREIPDSVIKTDKAEEIFNRTTVDVVSLILPNFLYEQHVELAAKYGAHVLMEKPFGHSLKSAQNMCKIIQHAGKQGFVGGQWKYYEHFLHAREWVRSHEVQYVTGGYAYWSNALTTHGWRMHRSKSGGLAAIDNGWHALDFVSHYMGHPCGVTAQALWHPQIKDIDIHMQLLLQYPDGTVATILADIASPVYGLNFTFNGVYDILRTSFEKVEYYKNYDLVKTETSADDRQGPMNRMYTEMKKAIAGESAYITTFDHAEKIMRVVDGAYTSARERTAISI